MNEADVSFEVQINQLDHVLIRPDVFDNSNLQLVPVIRIFGSTSSGATACVHVHQVYPYFYVSYPGVTEPTAVREYVSKFSVSLDHAIKISFRKHDQTVNYRAVRAVILVKGVHFYGFHSQYSPFLKIFLVDPTHITRAATILQSGTIMNNKFKTYESHLSYPLQFMCDFDLYGCGKMKLGRIYRRGEVNDSSSLRTASFQQSPYFRQTRSDYEVDVEAHQILNRYLQVSRDVHHQLSIPAKPMSLEPLIRSVRELWDDERKRRILRNQSPSPEMPSALSEGSRSQGGHWVAEPRWWDGVQSIINAEKGDLEDDDKIPEPPTWQQWVMSTFESVEALWKDEWRSKKFAGSEELQNPFSHLDQVPNQLMTEVLEVDEELLSHLEAQELFKDDEIDDDDSPEVYIDGSFREDDIEDLEEDELLDDTSDCETELQEPESVSLSHQEDVNSEISLPGPLSDSSRLQLVQDILRHSPEKRGNPFSSAWGVANHDIIRPGQETLHLESPPNVDTKITANLERETRVVRDSDNSDTIQTTFHADSNPIQETPISGSHHPSEKQDSLQVSRVPSCIPDTTRTYEYALRPPSQLELLSSISDYDMPHKIYQDPHYSLIEDVPEHSREYGGLIYVLKNDNSLDALEGWEDSWSLDRWEYPDVPSAFAHSCWEYAGFPPSPRQARQWLKCNNYRHNALAAKERSQIEGPTQPHTHGLTEAPTESSNANSRDGHNMSILACEVFALGREDFVSDPKVDAIVAIACSYMGSCSVGATKFAREVLALQCPQLCQQRFKDINIELYSDETELLNAFIDRVNDLDPDILVGWDTERSSWGYIAARGALHDLDVAGFLSRAPSHRIINGSEQWERRTNTTFRVNGRYVLNVWRLMRASLTLNIYTFENVVFNLLRQRVPRHKPAALFKWFNSRIPSQVARVIREVLNRSSLVLDILEKADIVTQTAEFARVFGVDFYSVLTRGSQFKVESFLFRIAKPENFVLISPSREDVGRQNATECMPLIMEPLSAFYNSPLLVLDFQSLYPSIMIAYNYCYSTCLGRVYDFQGHNKLGVVDLERPKGMMETLKEHLFVAPNGIIYVKPEVRKGLLGRMLTELLDTRIMVKHAMKGVNNKSLQKVLNARQLSLKFICNVTYGYTTASFSGRMPAAEIADSIVQSGRETLEKAIRTIDSTTKWGARVVYGDTDSLFVYLPGKTREQAFLIGHEIANTITSMNPAPVKLKFEKVYLPCVLLAKKRYVGFKYENPDDIDPIFDAKGIETVRRDGVPAQAKMTEASLKILFRSQDLSEVKAYCCRSWSKLLEERFSIQDFIFSKEVRLGSYSDKIPPPPGAAVAARSMIQGFGEAHYGERVPYVIVKGEPGAKLVDRAVPPESVLDSQMQLDADYYISRVLIPPLQRIFSLVGADVRSWYDEMPRSGSDTPQDVSTSTTSESEYSGDETETSTEDLSAEGISAEDISADANCLSCNQQSTASICDSCLATPTKSLADLLYLIRGVEAKQKGPLQICTTCTTSTSGEDIHCESLDCPWFFERRKAERRLDDLSVVYDLVDDMIDLDLDP